MTINGMKIYQMETTNYCNASCHYCPHRKMTREKGYIDIMNVKLVASHCKAVGQKYIALHHMGEPLLHPQIGKIIDIFKKYGVQTELSTNGLLLEKKGEEILKAGIKLVRIAVDNYYNTPNYINKVKRFLTLALQYPNTKIRIHSVDGNDLTVFDTHNTNVLLENKQFDNWAGEVEGESKLTPGNNCYFLNKGYIVVLWNGDISTCCMDYNGKSIIGHVNYINQLQENKSFESCKSCVGMQFAEGGNWE